ncbi:hypothetical protein RG931_003490 [Pseudomonas syringae pv. actinidiae]|nr:hypothetical protein BV361_03654 [Pseudomonas syringae pv. actinidiae]BBM06792.1 hypothetical protein KPSA3_100482 [Pseudomonas syringae pv. actinidiae]
MMSSGGKGIVGYNVQTAVDTKHHLIVAHEVTNVGHDRDQLSSMAQQAREAMQVESLSVVADRGYYKSGEILACHEAGITAYVPKTLSSRAKFDGRFGNEEFVYDADNDEYVCPANQVLIWRNSYVDKGKKLDVYWRSNCQACSIKAQCTPARERKVRRWGVSRTLASASDAVSKMGVGLPESACRSWLQTARCCCVQKAWW